MVLGVSIQEVIKGPRLEVTVSVENAVLNGTLYLVFFCWRMRSYREAVVEEIPNAKSSLCVGLHSR